MEDKGLYFIILFERDSIAYKTALSNHFNIVLVTHDSIHAIVDPALYHEAMSESPGM